MNIVDVSFDRFRPAAFYNQVEEGDRIWLPEEFEDEPPHVRVTLDLPERLAFLAGVVFHDDQNPDDQVLPDLGPLVANELRMGSGRSGEARLRTNSLNEYRVLWAGAWTVSHRATVSPTVLTQEAAKRGLQQAFDASKRFEDHLLLLPFLVAELVEKEVIPEFDVAYRHVLTPSRTLSPHRYLVVVCGLIFLRF